MTARGSRSVRWTPGQVRAHYARIGRAIPAEVEVVLEASGQVGQAARHPGHWAAHIERGRRADLNNIYFRSRAEANWARFLTYQGIRWEYEPETFDFLPFRQYRRNTSYTPDFWLPDFGWYDEIKGWMTPNSKTKLARMTLHYPQVKIRLVLWPELREVEAKLGRVIPGWEFGGEEKRTG